MPSFEYCSRFVLVSHYMDVTSAAGFSRDVLMLGLGLLLASCIVSSLAVISHLLQSLLEVDLIICLFQKVLNEI